MNKNIFECVGRMVMVALIAFAVNRTQWYKDLPIQTLTNAEPMTWIFCILLVLSFFWVGLPIMKFKTFVKEKEVEQ